MCCNRGTKTNASVEKDEVQSRERSISMVFPKLQGLEESSTGCGMKLVSKAAAALVVIRIDILNGEREIGVSYPALYGGKVLDVH